MRTWTRWSAAVAVSASLAAACGAAQAQDAVGDWHGTLSLPDNGPTLRVGVTFKAKAGGGYEGSYVTSTSTTALDQVKLDKGTLKFSIAATRMSFSGVWDEAQKAWIGPWSAPFAFVPTPGSPAANAPPAPPITLVLTARTP